MDDEEIGVFPLVPTDKTSEDLQQSDSHEIPATRVGRSAVWDVLIANPSVGVTVTNLDGVLIYANRASAQMFLGLDDPEPLLGKSLFDISSDAWAEERVAIYRQIAQTGQAAIMRHIRRGKQLQSTIHAIPTPEGEPAQFLSITHVGEQVIEYGEDEFFLVESSVVDLGPLDVLSTRELEVLALIGQGLTTQEIADVLYRSPKTVEGHRDSIARKLGESSRVRLGQIAQVAGLEVSDASLERMKDSSEQDTE